MLVNVEGPQVLKDLKAIKADAIFQAIVSKTPQEVGQYFDNNLSALSGQDPADIEAWVMANVTDLPSARAAIITLAQDSAFTSKHLKVVAKALVVLARQMEEVRK